MPTPTPDVTQMLDALGRGEDGAVDRLFPVVYDELRRLAQRVRQGPAMETLNTTALVHEAYLRLVGPEHEMSFESRAHFLAVTAKAMRHVLVDYARRRGAAKRGGGALRVDLTAALGAYAPPDDATLIAVDDALLRLGRLDARKARVVECRVFGGLTLDETAAALDVSAATVKRDWRMAQAWLWRELADAPGGDGGATAPALP